MKKLLSKLGFHKADEMEMSIQLKAIKCGWAYINIFLFGWCLYVSYQVKVLHLPYNSLPSFLFVTQNLVIMVAQYFLNYKATSDKNAVDDDDDDDDDNKIPKNTKPMLTIFVVLCLVVVIGLIGFLLLRFRG